MLSVSVFAHACLPECRPHPLRSTLQTGCQSLYLHGACAASNLSQLCMQPRIHTEGGPRDTHRGTSRTASLSGKAP